MTKKEQLFKEIVHNHKDKIYRVCWAYLYDKKWVDDLYQDVLINIWNGLERFKGEAKKHHLALPDYPKHDHYL